MILKIDGLNADLLYRTMSQMDPTTGKSRLPWFSHIFNENGTVFRNFYTRGVASQRRPGPCWIQAGIRSFAATSSTTGIPAVSMII